MNQTLRLARMIDLLEKQGELKANDLALQLGVSMETVRKDIHLLCMQGLAQKVYGGAIARNAGTETQLELRNSHQDQKSLIARAAISLIQDLQSILLDSGTTRLEQQASFSSIQPVGSCFEQLAFLVCETLVVMLKEHLKLSDEDLLRRHANLE